MGGEEGGRGACSCAVCFSRLDIGQSSVSRRSIARGGGGGGVLRMTVSEMRQEEGNSWSRRKVW